MKSGKLKSITKFFLYLSSFFPLFILLFIQNVKITDDEGNFLKWKKIMSSFFQEGLLSPEGLFWMFVFFFIFASIVSIFGFFFLYVNVDGASGKLVGQKFVRADTLGYIVTYIVPLITMDISSYRSLLINFLLFFIIGIFYIKNNQFFMNPIFNLLGYNILASDNGYIYITKFTPRKMNEIATEGTTVSLKNIAEDIYIVKDI